MATFIIQPQRKVIVAGSRDFNDYALLCSVLDELFPKRNIEIVSGNARGTDRLGERYAEDRWLNCMKFPANWAKYGKGAGLIRNQEMAEYADVLVAFWDYSSTGTKDMITRAKKEGLEVHVIDIR
jgi:hypothetical protein